MVVQARSERTEVGAVRARPTREGRMMSEKCMIIEPRIWEVEVGESWIFECGL